DRETDAVFVLTRHDTHGPLTARALEAGKHVFVEKPLALTLEELERIEAARAASGRVLMVGFNRRYARLAGALRDAFRTRAQPMTVVYRANVGYRPPEHWLHHPTQGGGVVLGEACHHIDFCRWIVGSDVTHVSVDALGGSGAGYLREDNFQAVL